MRRGHAQVTRLRPRFLDCLALGWITSRFISIIAEVDGWFYAAEVCALCPQRLAIAYKNHYELIGAHEMVPCSVFKCGNFSMLHQSSFTLFLRVFIIYKIIFLNCYTRKMYCIINLEVQIMDSLPLPSVSIVYFILL